VPFVPMGGMRQYVCTSSCQIFIWSFIGNAWSLMGRFGLVSLGHGRLPRPGRLHEHAALWNFFGLTPWVGAWWPCCSPRCWR
jgi:branched-chain amino acid transport system permease protein